MSLILYRRLILGLSLGLLFICGNLYAEPTMTVTVSTVEIENFRAIPSADSTILTWKYSVGDEDRFDIFSGSTAGSMSFLVTVSAFAREYVHNGLVTGTETYYQAEVYNSSNEIVGSSEIISAKSQSMSLKLKLTGYLHHRNLYGDIWGYTDSSGNEYALLCARNEGVSIIDINVTPPIEVGFMPSILPGRDAKDVKVYQHFAVVVKEYEDIQFFDIIDPTAPVQVATYSFDGRGAHNCLIDGDYLFVVGGPTNGGLDIIDISNPALPFKVGEYQPYYYHDIDIRNDTIAAAGINWDGIDLVDVSNKSAPSLIANWDYPSSGVHNVEFSADGTHLFQGDEVGGAGNHIRVWDISNLSSIELVSEISVNPNAVVHNFYVFQDTLLAIAYYTEGVRIWNVANPSSPFEIAYYDTYQPDAYSFNGCWTAYPYFASGKIVASDMQTGLYVLETDFPPPSICCDLAGDVNDDLSLDIADLSFTVDYMFREGLPPTCLDDADVNSDCGTNISDLTYRVNFMFRGGPALQCGCVVK